ncbi:uncharacterized protein LOC141900749 isoform X2 [Tubulanus polymorphus]
MDASAAVIQKNFKRYRVRKKISLWQRFLKYVRKLQGKPDPNKINRNDSNSSAASGAAGNKQRPKGQPKPATLLEMSKQAQRDERAREKEAKRNEKLKQKNAKKMTGETNANTEGPTSETVESESEDEEVEETPVEKKPVRLCDLVSAPPPEIPDDDVKPATEYHEYLQQDTQAEQRQQEGDYDEVDDEFSDDSDYEYEYVYEYKGESKEKDDIKLDEEDKPLFAQFKKFFTWDKKTEAEPKKENATETDEGLSTENTAKQEKSPALDGIQKFFSFGKKDEEQNEKKSTDDEVKDSGERVEEKSAISKFFSFGKQDEKSPEKKDDAEGKDKSEEKAVDSNNSGDAKEEKAESTDDAKPEERKNSIITGIEKFFSIGKKDEKADEITTTKGADETEKKSDNTGKLPTDTNDGKENSEENSKPTEKRLSVSGFKQLFGFGKDDDSSTTNSEQSKVENSDKESQQIENQSANQGLIKNEESKTEASAESSEKRTSIIGLGKKIFNFSGKEENGAAENVQEPKVSANESNDIQKQSENSETDKNVNTSDENNMQEKRSSITGGLTKFFGIGKGEKTEDESPNKTESGSVEGKAEEKRPSVTGFGKFFGLGKDNEKATDDGTEKTMGEENSVKNEEEKKVEEKSGFGKFFNFGKDEKASENVVKNTNESTSSDGGESGISKFFSFGKKDEPKIITNEKPEVNGGADVKKEESEINKFFGKFKM